MNTGFYPFSPAVTFVVTDLVYTGTIVEGMRVTGVIHETSNVTRRVRCLQELRLHIHLIELRGRGENKNNVVLRFESRSKARSGWGLLTIRYLSWLLTGTVFMVYGEKALLEFPLFCAKDKVNNTNQIGQPC